MCQLWCMWASTGSHSFTTTTFHAIIISVVDNTLAAIGIGWCSVACCIHTRNKLAHGRTKP